ncbi:acyltransferase family protein [Pelagibacteraceae bacterium]|nr:acyltransferase family protein [Pelagibacteraceae bacterium]
MKSPIYRPEIDGLRAISVLAVIIYHAKISFLDGIFASGGFLGVDIFFVISGYLITRLILYEIFTTKTFSFLNFYNRRARRILPVFFFIILFLLPFLIYFTLPNYLIDFSKSIIFSLFFLSNYFFWSIGLGYDQIQFVDLHPFLHTWSLSVEEQFYLIFPIVMVFLCKYFKNYIIFFLIAGFCVSLACAHYLSTSHASVNFYSLPTRIWQILAGSILAYLELKNYINKNKFFSLIFPLAGLILIFFSLLFFNDKMFLPSIKSLPLILGVGLVIFFLNHNNIIMKILQFRPIVGLGLISYSLYLWHFPLFMIFKQYNISILIFITFILSILSYTYIEQPFRKKNSISRIYSIKNLFFLFIIILLVNFIIIYNKGFHKHRDYPEIISNSIDKKIQIDDSVVSINNLNSLDPNKKNIYLVGDSHTMVLSRAIKNYKKIKNYNLINLYSSACYYIYGFDKVHKFTKKKHPTCDSQLQEARRSKIIERKESIVIISGRLDQYIDQVKITNRQEKKEQFDWYYFKSNQKNNLDVASGVLNSINDLLSRDIKVILIYPVPIVKFNINNKIFERYKTNKTTLLNSLLNEPITTDYKKTKNYFKKSYDILDELDHPNLFKIYPDKIFCNNEIKDKCALHNLKNTYYLDTNHLSSAGNKKLIDEILKVLN